MPDHPFINSLRAYDSLSEALNEFKTQQPEQITIDTAIARGYFLPEEDDSLWSLVSRYLTIRNGFWELINEMSSHFSDDTYNVKTQDDWRYFLLGYASSCQVVGMARLLVDVLAKHKLVQRKINEGSPQNRISSKVFTNIYQSLSDADNAIKMQYMMNFVDSNRDYIERLESDQLIGSVIKNLAELETNLHPSQRAFIKLRMKYLLHAITRRFAVSKQLSTFFILEKAGRVIADIGDSENKRVTAEILQQALSVLKPGDVIITRHDFVASNLFLPGYWPHAALYIGTEAERQQLGITLDDHIAERWVGEIRTLEAKKDGVLFRPLTETLQVDEFVVLRPRLDKAGMARALQRVSRHEGKGYNFDFDFFRSDQLVCTEVVYRAFDGLDVVDCERSEKIESSGNKELSGNTEPLDKPEISKKIAFKLIERAGRFSLSAEDLLDMAMQQRGFDVVAAFGFTGCVNQLILNEQAHQLVKTSYSSKTVSSTA
jgi:hypothetical protein